jgi:CRP-like cAMP-binding protein
MPLSSCYLFEGLSQSQIERIVAIIQEQKFQKQQWVFNESQEATHLYLVKDGAVELVTRVEDTIEIPVSIIRPKNGFLGLSALLEPYRYSLSARCLDDSTLITVSGAQLIDLMNADSEMRCVIMTNLATKLLNRLKETRQEVKIHFMNLVRSVTY